MIEPLSISSDNNANEAAVSAARQGNGRGLCLAAVVLLIVGVFVATIPCGVIAYNLSKTAITRGSVDFGTIMKWISTIYVGLMILMIFVV